MAKKSRPTVFDSPKRPIATIYQNSDQVAGILQQIARQPLLTEESRELTAGEGVDTSATGGVSGQGTGKVKIPLVGGGDLGAEANASLASSWTQTTGTASRQQFVYSQAYNLHLVRHFLEEASLLTSLTETSQAEKLQPGAFVEYTSAFAPVELSIALDVVSPELVEAIARYTVKKDYVATFPAEYEARGPHAEKMRLEADAKGELARAITDAVKADSRQSTTREYYGRIADEPALTAITICDLSHFIVDDPDRLLDGTFTVLGKVISEVEENVPTFARNKLLRNLAPEALDQGLDQLYGLINAVPVAGGKAPSEYIDLKLESRVPGSSVRVLPLAIYS